LRFFTGKDPKKEQKLKTPRELSKILEMTKKLLKKIFSKKQLEENIGEITKEREKIAKYIQLINILEKNKFEGLNRKI